ncbi:alpha/beta hydrolase [Streptomyces tirandamycinicus]|uniref:alpha/beta hydrolase n=1 Tax=Streptomyces TaxID=1883 RepID=UPI00201812B4|nr:MULTISPECIES: alpha/beta hydrolase [Streptomyces]MCY0984668.1 alpha/beta hydrolase [Streptomyces tirandamycinicus]
MRRFSRAAVTAAVAAAVVTGTGGWVSDTAQTPVTGPPPGTEEWRSDRSLGRALPDPGSASPDEVAAFFADLTDTQRQRLTARHPFVVGNLDGAPISLRYRANALALGALGSGTDGRQILVYDRRGRGQLAEVFGDLSRARRVAVVVPGSDIDAGTFDRTREMARSLYEAANNPGARDGGTARDDRASGGAWSGNGYDRAEEDPGNASSPENTDTETGHAGGTTTGSRPTDGRTGDDSAGSGSAGNNPTGTVAVIAWAGYTTPVGVGLDAAAGDLAEAGAERLARFTRGVAATGAPRPALFCHSYGSVVCGLAAERADATDIVALGSPGMRADTVADLHTGARVWAAKAPSDWISKVPNIEFAGLGHGTDPTAPEFGARRVPAGDTAGHAGYFAPGTSSLRAFASIARGAAR